MDNNATNSKFIIKWLETKIKRAREEVEREIVKIPNRAQNSFDKFVPYVPADDPYVFVYSTFDKQEYKTTLTITCVGNQVLFIEFGAGVYYGAKEVDIESRFYISQPLNQRPSGVDDIGSYHLALYGRSQGKDDYWFYTSRTGRESENAHYVKPLSNGATMITHGNRPARALYRAVIMSMRKISSITKKKIRKIATQ